jgi:hypothetical protein
MNRLDEELAQLKPQIRANPRNKNLQLLAKGKLASKNQYMQHLMMVTQGSLQMGAGAWEEQTRRGLALAPAPPPSLAPLPTANRSHRRY